MASRWCPEHIKFRDRPISKRNMPPDLELERWASTSRFISDRGYVKRWTKRWAEVVRVVAAMQGSFSALPMDDIGELVRHERLAALHRHFAEQDPYPKTESGGTKAHPAWERARIEEVSARATARRLGLLPAVPSELTKKSARDGYSSKLQTEAEERGALVDDQADL